MMKSLPGAKARATKIMAAAAFSIVFFSGSLFASPRLSVGMEGQEVLLLQKKLQNVGYKISDADGVFGSETEKAVEEFQRDKNIRITGVVTNSTWRALQTAKDGEKKKGGRAIKESKVSLRSVAAHKTFLTKKEAKELIAEAKALLGTPYVFGGANAQGFDCSGYLQYTFAQIGIEVPRLANDQYSKLGLTVKDHKKLVAGDLVFFSTYEEGASHCGIYLGDGEFIHASSSRGIAVDELADQYWKSKYIGGKHIVK